MPKTLFYVRKIKPEEIVEENKHYVVMSGNNSQMKSQNKYIVISKKDKGEEIFMETDEYKIIGSTVIYRDRQTEGLLIFNQEKGIVFGIGNRKTTIFDIDSYATAIVDGKEQTIIKYKEELYPNLGDLKTYKLVRLIDDEGNLYKKPKNAKVKICKDESLSV